MQNQPQARAATSAVAPIIHLDYPPAITADLLSGLIGQSVPTILANRSRAPHKLPPACVAPGTKQPVWLLTDVLAWLASHRERETAVDTPIAKDHKPRIVRAAKGRPAKTEQAEAKRLGLTVRELRSRSVQQGGAA